MGISSAIFSKTSCVCKMNRFAYVLKRIIIVSYVYGFNYYSSQKVLAILKASFQFSLLTNFPHKRKIVLDQTERYRKIPHNLSLLHKWGSQSLLCDKQSTTELFQASVSACMISKNRSHSQSFSK